MNLPDVKIGDRRSLNWRERLAIYVKLIRLDRPIGIFLLLWPALWALWIAGEGNPPWGVVLIFAGGVVLMRSAGCAINDFADRELDAQVARTRGRPIATGLVSPWEAVAVFLVLSLAAFALVLLLNWQTIALSVVAVGLAAIYPFMKRYTHVPQLVLGAAFGWAVPMAFTAITGSVPPIGWLLFAATVLWALIYDTQYAMVDLMPTLRSSSRST
ncbi:MAG: 4-hydroxybenzoate octaprenyltransferase, partial [Pseudomonadota bacterium]|nr:4-hydroxybenzoate octaprenyltransferase [Pseudomonadota bacterium]